MFINISNHPSSKWNTEQIEAAKKLGREIIDIPFPSVDPTLNKVEVFGLAKEVTNIVFNKTNQGGCLINYVHIMGESGFVYALIKIIEQNRKFFTGIYICVHSTTERIVEEKDGQKISTFKFVQFREY